MAEEKSDLQVFCGQVSPDREWLDNHRRALLIEKRERIQALSLVEDDDVERRVAERQRAAGLAVELGGEISESRCWPDRLSNNWVWGPQGYGDLWDGR